MKTIYLDCGMGAAGDMLMAALLELHPQPEAFLQRLNTALEGKALVAASPAEKQGIRGTHVSVTVNGEEEGEQHHHGHHHPHTHIADIISFIASRELPEKVKQDASSVYQLIARAESQVHGKPVENIHLHELGSLDALADVLGVCLLVYELAADNILASPVHVGSGSVRCAHGILPVPAPATELLLRDIPIYSTDIKGELCTPTGAALLKYFVSDFVPLPEMRVRRSGYGCGKKDFPRANVLRALLGTAQDMGETILELSCNIDDMSAEDLSFAMERLFDAGALDVYFTNIGMKKSRPAVMLTCMCRPPQRETMLRCIFQNTSTLGVRQYVSQRYTLKHRIDTVETCHGPVRVKHSQGYGTERSKPEYEDLASISRQTNIPIYQLRKDIKSAET